MCQRKAAHPGGPLPWVEGPACPPQQLQAVVITALAGEQGGDDFATKAAEKTAKKAKMAATITASTDLR